MSSGHCIRVAALLSVLTLATTVSPHAQGTLPAVGASTFKIFLRSAQIGTADIRLARDARGWLITSSGRMGPPLNLVTRLLEVRYDADWRPLEVTIDATAGDRPVAVHTVVSGANVTTTVGSGAAAQNLTEPIDDTAIFLPNPFFGAFEALAIRLRSASEGSIIPIYSGPRGAYTAKVGASAPEQIQTAAAMINARRTLVQLLPPNAPPLDISIWADETGRLLRLSVPAQSLEVVREDVGSVAARRVVMARPNDEQVRIPSVGFTLAGTISKPTGAGTEALPALVLVGSSGETDRDETISEIPIFAELAGALADKGFLVLRYDKRGVGQSGGRPESAALDDYAEDLRAAVKFLADRKDVDDRRMAVLGYSEGGMVALVAADREKKVRAVVLVASPGVTGAELNMAQIRHENVLTGPSSEADATLQLQGKIQTAVLSGKGWEGIDPALRARADTPWFKSFLAFDPARWMRDLDQPIMIVQGGRDTQVEPSNADRLAELAAARKKAPPPEVLKIPEINHLLVPATTGEVSEYASLAGESIGPGIADAIAKWLSTTLPPRR
jgi:pimeloyl-ACP methyl ester carboxylesterase